MEEDGKDSNDGEPLKSRGVVSHNPFQAGAVRSFTMLLLARRFTVKGSKEEMKVVLLYIFTARSNSKDRFFFERKTIS
jgi:hypothetical protein